MSAISETIESIKTQINFIAGLNLMKDYATEAFTIDVIEVGVISVHGCKFFSDNDYQTLIDIGWEPWANKTGSGAEFRKLNYMET